LKKLSFFMKIVGLLMLKLRFFRRFKENAPYKIQEHMLFSLNIRN